MYASAQRPKNSLPQSVFFHHVDPGNGIRVIRLGSRNLYGLSHFANQTHIIDFIAYITFFHSSDKEIDYTKEVTGLVCDISEVELGDSHCLSIAFP